ncbi:probable ATP-dependent RNA helicase DDX10 [Pomacea canaliculata]|uniref:probable ATP-dependent RNA helicase DDX10 n=1 Tax=Pomacea canaliculata TaxID=400727 RepID=UPI000D730C36|nr:probable ATP-dependent RNA helicase DDX10 [Pomacea canaliculata]
MEGKSFGQKFTFKRKRRGKSLNRKSAVKKNQVIIDEIADLNRRISEGIVSSKIKSFTDFPLSRRTLDGLKNAKYEVPTEIQRECIGLALQNRDVLGASKTGSGKTLAFIIPVLETLYKMKGSQLCGLCALIISPTRELAYQTFEVLKKVGRFHDFSAGLVIGGKPLQEEAERIANTNVIVCTPGRLLQHFDETFNFSADCLQILVLDEADRILDLGFAKAMNAIIANLPAERQTLLFSATQTKSVKDLARLSLFDPVYVSAHENAAYSTPVHLVQSYIVCDLHQKISLLWSFLKNHPRCKILVFLTCCKQVKFVHEVIRRLQPGMTVLCLHGGMKQLKRVEVYEEFYRKQHVVLFATDIASRGLDFPAVNWVVQLDCPEDTSTYIHRVGRTARFEREGEALLVLLPTEEDAMIQQLQSRKIPINKIRVNQKRMMDLSSKLQALCASDTTLKEMAQRAFRTYLRSILLMKDKKVFDVQKLDTEAFSKSLGLAIPPRIRFLGKHEAQMRAQDSSSGQDTSSEDESEDSHDETDESSEHLPKARESQSNRKNEHFAAFLDEEDTDDDGEIGMFRVKKTAAAITPVSMVPEETENEEEKNSRKRPTTKAAIAKRMLKKSIVANTKTKFDDEGNAVIDIHKKRLTDDQERVEDEAGGINVEAAAKRMRMEDMVDKDLYRQKIKQKHREERLKKKERLRAEKAQRRAGQEDEEEAVLASADDDVNPLNFIPDPDELAARISAQENNSGDERSSFGEEEDESSDNEENSGCNHSFSESVSQTSDEEETRRESVQDDEDLALRLLAGAMHR